MNWFKKLFKKEEEYASDDLRILVNNKLIELGIKWKMLIDVDGKITDITSMSIPDMFVGVIPYIHLTQKEEGNDPCFNTGWKLDNLLTSKDPHGITWKELHPYCQNCCWNKWCR
jgi:hypothetical protein